jgi:DNA-binding transcriptional ArsR family regulator
VVETYEGADSNKQLWDDIYMTLKDVGGEVLIANVDESKTIDSLSKAALESHLERLKKANITERLLIRKGDTTLVAPHEFYHVIPEEYFSAYPFYIYGQKLGLVSRHPTQKVIVINDERFSDGVRRLFNYVWERTERPVLTRDM